MKTPEEIFCEVIKVSTPSGTQSRWGDVKRCMIAYAAQFKSDHSDEEAAFTKRGIDLLEDIESEILSFMMATENQMLKKGLRETVQIVQRHKKKILDNPTFTDYLKSKQEL